MSIRGFDVGDLPEWLCESVRAVAVQMAKVLSAEEVSASQSEERVVELSRELGRDVLGRGLSERYGRHEGTSRSCSCGQRQRFEGYREKTLMTLLGPVRYQRAYYRCTKCGASYYCGDEAVGLALGSYSLPAQEAVSLVCCEVPFETGRELLGRLTGIDISNSHAQVITQRHGDELERCGQQQRDALFAGELQVVPENCPDRLYITLDGLKMPFTDDWHETKVGSVYDVVRDDEGIDTPHRTTHTCGTREGPDAFGRRLYQEAIHRGLELSREHVVVADGAPWTWNIAAEHFPGAMQILDFYHAAQRLHEVGRAVYGDGTAKARQWAEANRKRLLKGRLVDVFRSLRGLRPRTAEGRDAVRTAIGYYQNNSSRMDYPKYRAMGCHIGSGVVEAACKTVAAARCKRSGMRWSQHGAQSVLTLRCLRLNGRWDGYWKHLKAAA